MFISGAPIDQRNGPQDANRCSLYAPPLSFDRLFFFRRDIFSLVLTGTLLTLWSSMTSLKAEIQVHHDCRLIDMFDD
jgi:hypothetical protein